MIREGGTLTYTTYDIQYDVIGGNVIRLMGQTSNIVNKNLKVCSASQRTVVLKKATFLENGGIRGFKITGENEFDLYDLEPGGEVRVTNLKFHPISTNLSFPPRIRVNHHRIFRSQSLDALSGMGGIFTPNQIE